MEIKILASTKPGYCMTADEAIDFSGKSAGICYLPDTTETLFNEPAEKTLKRAKNNIALVLLKTAIKSGKMSREAVSEFCSGHIAFKMTLGETAVRGLLSVRRSVITICQSWEKRNGYLKGRCLPERCELKKLLLKRMTIRSA